MFNYKFIPFNNKEPQQKVNASNWLRYEYKNNKIICTDPSIKEDNPDDKEKKEKKEKEKKQQEINNTMLQISIAINENRWKYMKMYDELHGEGSYHRLYYLKQIYDNLDDFGDDSDSECDYEQDSFYENVDDYYV
jgi:hypothetical protein